MPASPESERRGSLPFQSLREGLLEELLPARKMEGQGLAEPEVREGHSRRMEQSGQNLNLAHGGSEERWVSQRLKHKGAPGCNWRVPETTHEGGGLPALCERQGNSVSWEFQINLSSGVGKMGMKRGTLRKEDEKRKGRDKGTEDNKG